MCLGDWCRLDVITDNDLLSALMPEERVDAAADDDVDGFFYDDVDD